MPDHFKQTDAGQNRLAAFIRKSMAPIVDEWSDFARTRTPASDKMTALALKDHIEEMLAFIADDLETHQTSAEQVAKSQGERPQEEGGQHSAAEIHAALRLSDGFDIDQMVSEYRALRASVTKLWIAEKNGLDREDLHDLIRFNEAIDQSVTESIARYTMLLDRSRNVFLGILGHDLRNPIGAASMSADMMIRNGTLDVRQGVLASQIKASTLRATRIIEDLLDLTRRQFGSSLSISRSKIDMAVLSKQLIEEIQALYPGRDIQLQVTGDTEVHWDKGRLGQVLSNLIGNAMEHGVRNTPVAVVLSGDGDCLALTVRNMGEPIAPDEVDEIFDLFKQGTKEGEGDEVSRNLGLGLYITKQIVIAHGGTIAVTSTESDGTSFTAVIPRGCSTPQR